MNSEIKTLEGKMNAAGLRVGIVCARFNSIFVEQLLSGAVDTLLRAVSPAAAGRMTEAWCGVFHALRAGRLKSRW